MLHYDGFSRIYKHIVISDQNINQEIMLYGFISSFFVLNKFYSCFVKNILCQLKLH